MRLILILLLGALCTPAFSQDDARLRVLFLGDDGHHQPALRVREILPQMADRGIALYYTDRVEHLNPVTLGHYDVIAMYGNHSTLSPSQEDALLDFVEDGGGLVAIHSASAMFGNSDAFIGLVGGAFKSHGTGVFRTKRVLPGHPVLQDVPEFESWDETYVHMKLNPDIEVLSVREENGREEPWTWIRSHGDGRVFYTAWGHDERTWSNPGFGALLEHGIRWAAGDWALEADLSPPQMAYEEGELPYYPPGVGWGITGEPITRVQKPLEPDASMRQLSVEPGFHIELFASEPQIVNPIDMTWDERGRLWVVETLDYPNEFEPHRIGNDRIKILEDTDGDGRADKETLFAEGLNIPTSLTLANGGVIVAQAPDMLFLKDNDGDDRADVKEVLFTGWGTFDTHAGPGNLRYGFDNRIWGTVGYSGFNGAVSGDSVRISQGFYRFEPDGSSLEVSARTNNNTWGLGFSEEGHVFASTANGNPSNFMAIPARYYERLAHRPGHEKEGKVPVLHPIADNSAIYPITDDVRQVDWHGRYTSAAGFEIYTARSFPREYWNRIAFVSEPPGHLLGKFRLEQDGGDFTATNEWNMVAGRDAWFAPIQAKVGPDGAVWFIDWYNLVIQHNPTPPGYEQGAGNAYVSELRDRRHSRIYRLVYEHAPERSTLSLGDASARDLVRALREDNLHWRLTAQRLLVERGEDDVIPDLLKLIKDERVDELGLNVGAIHALWTLHGLGSLDGSNGDAVEAAVEALHHPSAGVRRAAAMVLPRTEKSLEALLNLLPDGREAEASEYTVPEHVMAPADAQVLLAVLLSLADMPASDRAGEAAAAVLLVPENANDRWIRDAAAIAGAAHAEGFLGRILEEDLGVDDSTYAANVGYAVEIVSAGNAGGDVVSLLNPASGADPVVAAALLEGLTAGWPEGEAREFSDSDRAAIQRIGGELSPDLRERLEVLTKRWGNPHLLSEVE